MCSLSYKYVIYEKDGPIARITLNRPDKMNAIDFPGQGGIADDFAAALAEAEDDEDLKVVILRGAGKSFCAGHDLATVYSVYESHDKEPGKRRPSQTTRLSVDKRFLWEHQRLLLHSKITIAQVHGHCIGEGSYYAEMCDLIVVADDAHISHAEQRIGFAGSGANVIPLFLRVGYTRARDLLLTGRTFDGKEAERIGWATKSVPPDMLEQEVDKLAQQITLLPRDGIAIGKAANHQILDILGATQGWQMAYLTHTLFTNLRFEPEEFSLLKNRKKKGAKAAFHERDNRYSES